jgi:hypothetical protein
MCGSCVGMWDKGLGLLFIYQLVDMLSTVPVAQTLCAHSLKKRQI